MSAADSWPDLPPGDSLAPVDWHCVYVVVSGTDVCASSSFPRCSCSSNGMR